MKKILGIFTVLLLVSFLTVNLMANIGNVPGLQKGTDITTTQVGRTMSNISNWGYWVYSDGKSANDPHGSSGGIYPRGTAGAVYRDGFIWGGKVDLDGDGIGDTVQVGGQTYNTGTVAGRILPDNTGADANDEKVKVYRIRADYKDLTVEMVKQDAMEINLLGSLGDVTDAMCEAVITEYEESWNDWPAEWGAPYTDVDGDGEYNPAVDKAGLADADQVLWLVINDLNPTATRGLYGSDPMGLELQITIWAYNQPGARLGQVIFKKYKLINKSGKDITDMYVSQWADPDLGDYGDDLCGCDTTLSLGFAYNGNAVDNKYAAFGLAPAAFGYDFFQGPMVPSMGETAVFDLKKVADHKNLGMTSFGWFAAGSPISDPTLGEYEGTRQWYNLLQGFKPFDDLAVPAPWTEGNASGGTVTKYPLAGDPVAGTGFLDAQDGYYPPGDRRITLSSGPFTFSAGDTQEVVVAAIGGLGGDRLSSVKSMKGTDQIAQSIYDNLFAEIPKPPVSPKVTATAFENSIMLNWGNDQDAIGATEGAQSLDYEFEGYNVYQLPTASSSLAQGKKIATFDVINNITNIRGTVLDPDLGEIDKNIQEGSDTGIKRFFHIEKNCLTETKLNEGQTYWFAVTAYNQDVNLIVDKALESAKVVLAVTVQEELPGTILGYDEDEILTDETVEHTKGTAGGDVSITVVNPHDVIGHDYKFWFNLQHYYLDDAGLWKTTNYPDSIGKLGKTTDLTGSYLSAAPIYGEEAGTVDMKFYVNVISPDYDYSDGVKLTFPSNITINSASSAEASYSIDTGENSVMFGTNDTTGDGPFSGGQVVTVNVNTPSLPLTVDYKMFDDGWATGYGEPYASLGDGIVHIDSSLTIYEIGNAFKTMKYWNLYDKTDEVNVLEEQSIVAGINVERIVDQVYYPGGEEVGTNASAIVDGLLTNVAVGYSAPTDFTGVDQTFADGTTTYRPMWHMNYFYNNGLIGAVPYMIDSYMQHGWSEGNGTAQSIDAYGYGTTDVNLLQRDYELRFTGEYDADEGNYHPIKDGTGSLAILRGARGYDIADHPDSNNPGDGSAFFVRIPFEVWDMEAPDGPQQVSILIYDRKGDPTATDFYAFNPDDRMYCEFLVEPYADVIAGSAGDYLGSSNLTWNTVWWNTQWTTGDVLHFIYDNPIQQGVDEWSFSTEAVTTGDDDEMAADLDKINVFPNPFYAHNPLASHRYDEYITFTHLPEKATIQIYNLAGVLVTTVEHNNANSQFEQWDLTNASGLPVASGMYIAYINMPDESASKILKFVIIQKKQILEYY